GMNPGTHTYNTWGDYTIRLRAYTPYCESTADRPVKIIPPVPIAGYTTDKLEGCTPLTVRFTNTSTYARTYIWEFGDGGASSDENPVYTYTLPGTYTVTLIATGDGGKDTSKTYSITVFEPAVSWFSLSPVTVIAPDDFVNFTDLSTNAISWLWEFGDGDTSHQQNPRHNYRE
ncbi:MAG: PKD domain-containing protein, partial [Bacteroidales bacterium]|nr:PKD domain-containing protein [Bacteroidales bacterium]